MSRARNVAQAAWTHQALRISSWTCMGPRQHRETSVSESKSEENTVNSSDAEILHPSTSETETLPSSYHSEEIEIGNDEGISETEDLIDHATIEDSMTDVELWQQLEHELNQPMNKEAVDDEDEIVKEVRDAEEDEITAASEAVDRVSVETTPTEMRRFFPPGKIMHIVSIPQEKAAEDGEENREGDDNGCRTTKLPKYGIYLTPRSLYGKLRLSRMMINDHYMPMYRRNIELVISELEKDGLLVDEHQL